jgi:predicted thioredoxin/glutaredoxin
MAIISGGTAHQLTLDIRSALQKNARAATAWERLTPLARNEWICWVTFVKKEETRKDHVKRLVRELQEGKRRPCYWLGCTHRTDKEISPSIKGILARRATQK